MNKQTFIQLITNPSGISPEQLLELEKVVAGFPYCQSAYILIAKQAAETGSMLADQKLKKAAAYTLDRKNLKKLLQGATETPVFEISNNFTEVITEEKTLTENPVTAKEISTIPEEVFSNVIEKKNDEEKDIVQTEEKTTLREALTDEKRDQIIKELQENLKRLHENKIKAAWEEVPKELKVIGVNDQPEDKAEEKTETSVSIEKENTLVPVDISANNEEKNNEQENSLTTAVAEEKVNDNKEIEEEKTIKINPINESFVLSPASETLLSPHISIYPIRTEDVIVEIKETEADTDLLLEYIHFLEEKRSVFRKNKKKEESIIDKIIKDDPSIPKLDINNLPDTSVDLSSKSIIIAKGPVSENFAKILSLQGKREKAIEIYEQLILKNPEKKPYFEAQIEKLKNRI